MMTADSVMTRPSTSKTGSRPEGTCGAEEHHFAQQAGITFLAKGLQSCQHVPILHAEHTDATEYHS